MLRLQMYLPNALRKEVFDFLPSPPPFSWFFFGKKVFDPDLEKVCLEVKRPAQFYCATSGVSYEVSEPSRRILITREGENEEKAREVCRRGELAGYASGPRAYLFHGVQEQSYLYHAMVEALGWRAAGCWGSCWCGSCPPGT